MVQCRLPVKDPLSPGSGCAVLRWLLPVFICVMGLHAGDLPGGTLDITSANILELQEAYADGLTSERVVQACLARIAAYEDAGPKLNAFISINPRALEAARELDAERRVKGPRTPLHGVPLLIKDNIDTRDLPTTGGARALAGWTPRSDAFVVARLRAAGAIILGKTNLDEFGMGATGTSSLGGQTLNPYNPAKVPGGSSTGTAVGVAACFGWAGLGTESGSSVRNPGAKNNLVALVPTSGLVSLRGVMPGPLEFQRVGVLARNVTDAAMVLSVISGVDPGDRTTLSSVGHVPADSFVSALMPGGLRRARIGVLRQLFGVEEEDRTATRLVEDALAVMSREGAEIIDPVSAGMDLWSAVRRVSSGSGGDVRAGMDYYLSSLDSDSPVSTFSGLAASAGILGRTRSRFQRELSAPPIDSSEAYAATHRARNELRRVITALMDAHHLDAVVYPHETKPARSLAIEVPDGGQSAGPADNRGPGKGNTLSSATGMPTIVVPVGFNSDGIGVGLEILGRRFSEGLIMRLAFSYEQAAPHRRLPSTAPFTGSERLTY